NSFWVSGAGVLEQAVPAAPQVRVDARLQAPAQRGDAAAHAQAWQAVDADSCAALLAVLRAGGQARLTLCGGRAAQSFEPADTGVWSRFKQVLGLQPLWDGREQL
ncbi:MAG: phosphoglycerate mutase, partial [Polaromonas sp.]